MPYTNHDSHQVAALDVSLAITALLHISSTVVGSSLSWTISCVSFRSALSCAARLMQQYRWMLYVLY